MFDIIAVDISGRHKDDGCYTMVCAAVAASVTPNRIEKVNQVNIRSFRSVKPPDINMVVEMMETTISELDHGGTIVTEPGDMFNKPLWLVRSMFTVDFKYEESLGERLCMEFAHHVSISARRFLLREKTFDERP